MARFRLERLLQLRAQLRRLRQLEAEQVGVERTRLEATRAALGAEREHVLVLAARASEGSAADQRSLRLAYGYAPALAAREQDTERGLADAVRRLAAKREEIAHERREERKLEHLEERHRARVAEAAARVDERLLDEIMLARHARAQREDDRGA